jgi:hypothetical protein
LKRLFINSNSTVHKEKEMVDFRKAIPLVAVLVFALGFASAQQPLSCQTFSSTPTLRAEGAAEEIGRIDILCQGGTPTPSGNAVPRTVVRLTMAGGNNITSRLITAFSQTRSEASLLIDEPQPSTPQVLETVPPATCNAPYAPSCGNVWLARPTGNAATVEWQDIPFDPPGPGNFRKLTLVNVRVNVAAQTGGNLQSLVPLPVQAFLSSPGTFSLPITNPIVTVGFIEQGMSFSLRNSGNTATITSVTLAQCATPSDPAFHARFSERFTTAFRLRGDSNPQDNPTVPYNTESMFWGPVYNPLGLTVPPGQATFATHLRLAFSGMPTGVTIYVPSTITIGTLTATLVPVGTEGSTAAAPATLPTGIPPGSWLVGLTGGSGSAVYRVTATSTTALENLDVEVYIRYSGLPTLGSGSVSGTYAPLSTTDLAAGVNVPLPRFYQNPSTLGTLVVAACETRLLFPFLTSIPGWDTGIAISNTTVDPFSTPAQSGACTLFFYGTPGNSSQTSASIPAGGQLLMTLSNGNSTQNLSPLTGFTGYMIARCNFQYAHGYAFISDLGANKFAQGYIALVMGDGLTSRYSANAAEALNQ